MFRAKTLTHDCIAYRQVDDRQKERSESSKCPNQTLNLFVSESDTPSVNLRPFLLPICVAAWLFLNAVIEAHAATAVTLSPTGVHFGYVNFGQTKTRPVVLTNIGTTTIDVQTVTAPASPFGISQLSAMTLSPGQSITFSVSFQPTSGGAATGKVTISSSVSATPLVLILYGTGVPGILSANPKILNFGAVSVGTTKTLNQVIINPTSQVTISKASVAGAGFAISGISVPLTLAAGQSYTFPVSFTPQYSASTTGTLSIVSSGQNSTLTINLRASGGSGDGGGTGTKLSFAIAALRFGYVPMGTSKTLTGALVANGGDVEVSSAVSSSPEFVVGRMTFPQTVKAGKPALFTVVFTPQLAGGAAGTVTFASSADTSPSVEVVSGVGTGGVHHQVTLQWAPSTSFVAGYNVYRGANAAGPFARINHVLSTSTTFVDSTVLGGKTYYYVTTAVNARGGQSRYSNEVRVNIPTP